VFRLSRRLDKTYRANKVNVNGIQGMSFLHRLCTCETQGYQKNLLEFATCMVPNFLRGEWVVIYQFISPKKHGLDDKKVGYDVHTEVGTY